MPVIYIAWFYLSVKGFWQSDISQETKVPTDHFIFIHESRVHSIAVGILFGYKGVLQLLALLLAFRTRKIKVKGLDDAKSIIAAVYISTIGLVLLTISTYLLKEYINAFVIVRGFCIVLATTVVMALVFLPLVSEYIYNSESEYFEAGGGGE